MGKPTFLIIHGAWHQPAHFTPLITALKAHGYRVLAPALPSVANSPTSSLQLDIDVVRTVIAEELALGNDVILVPHSYGGIVSTGAAKGYDKKSRSRQHAKKQGQGRGEKNGVVAIAAMTAFVLPEGKSIPVAQGKSAAGIGMDNLTVDPLPPTSFYNDLPEADIEKWTGLLKPMSLRALLAPSTYSAHQSVDIHFLMCTDDLAMKLATQERVVAWLNEEMEKTVVAAGDGRVRKVRTEVLEKCGHSPFLSRVDETVAFLRRSAGEVV